MAARGETGQSVSRHRSTLSLQKTEITIHVYDLLPAGRLSSVLWSVGASLLHSGVVINGREYAYGGHDKRGVTGVYWTKPKTKPPGGTFKCEILHGFTLATHEEIDATLRATSKEFLGLSYNLLTKNCNHFTSYLCKRLTGTAAPGWLNRAASIGVALPCVVPREWIEPPEYDAADGELVNGNNNDDGGDDESTDEQSHMLAQQRPHLFSANGDHSDEWSSEDERNRRRRENAKPVVKDNDGRTLPPSQSVLHS